MKEGINFFWFRRDLRLEDNCGLFHALNNQKKVQCVFIFDSEILNKLENKSDARVEFIYLQLKKLNEQLKAYGSSLWVKFGNPLEIWNKITRENPVNGLYFNHDYEPYAISRDKTIEEYLAAQNIPCFSFKDQVIFEKKEVVKDDGAPYTVFTPYMKKWKSLLIESDTAEYNSGNLHDNFQKGEAIGFPDLKEIGFHKSGYTFPDNALNPEQIIKYQQQRDIPSIPGTTRLSVHLRFGTISIRKLVKKARGLSETWLNELIWREFYMMILWNFPHVEKSSFKPAYDAIPWQNNEDNFARWCEGKTGYPIVDAGMRELNKTGFMHNRVRMIVSSFLTKHLLIDWRWGEAYFAAKLLDFELSSNNGGWQWAAGSGCDAAPYFRIFNPYEQTRKFDPNLHYIKKWIPEYDELNYIAPIVDHKQARQKALDVYKRALNQTGA